MIKALFLAGALSGVTSAAANAVDCIVEGAISTVALSSMQRSADIAGQIKPLLDQFSLINDKAADPKKSLGAQLSPGDLEKFGRLQQRLMTLQIYQSIESGYSRDAEVIGMMFSYANAEYNGTANLPAKDSAEFQAALMLNALRQIIEKEDWPVTDASQTQTCTIELALQRVEQVRFQKMQYLDLDKSAKQLEEIKSRYKTIDKDKLPFGDRAEVERITRDSFIPARREQTFINDLENLKGLWKAAQFKYDSNMKDAINSAGNTDSIGQTIDNAKLLPRDSVYMRTILKISELIPSQHAKQMSTIAEIQKRLAPPTDIRPTK